jgi:hypothetical protein
MSDSTEKENLRLKGPIIAAASITIVSVAALFFMGRVWWCKVGDMSPWAWDVWSPHNSQHFIDPYSFTHVLHGMLEFWLIGIVFFRVPLVWRFVIAIFIESSWEVLENTNWIIERYREATMSLDYFGDSILNSAADIACCGIGFWIAYKLRFWRTMALFAVTEIILLFWIRDSLIVNLIMLLWPIDAIKQWQIGAG